MTEGRHALIIANYHYEDPNLSKLIAPPQDAENLARVLADPQVGGFTVKQLINKDFSIVREEIEGFFAEKKLDDFLLLYFSGHGIKDERGHLFYAFPNTKLKRVRATAIGANFINDMMQSSRSHRQVVILDCCYSGAFSRGMLAKADRTIITGESFKEGRGKVVLTASDAMQYAFEGEELAGEGVSSIFTKYLIRGLETGEADANNDGDITLQELYDYVYEQVKRELPQQSPQKWDFGLEGKICIACNPNPVIKPAELPAELALSLTDMLPWNREGAARTLKELLFGSDKSMALAAHEALKRLVDDDSFKVRVLVGKILEEYAAQQPSEDVLAAKAPVVEEEIPPSETVAAETEEVAAQEVKAEHLPDKTVSKPETIKPATQETQHVETKPIEPTPILPNLIRNLVIGILAFLITFFLFIMGDPGRSVILVLPGFLVALFVGVLSGILLPKISKLLIKILQPY